MTLLDVEEPDRSEWTNPDAWWLVARTEAYSEALMETWRRYSRGYLTRMVRGGTPERPVFFVYEARARDVLS